MEIVEEFTPVNNKFWKKVEKKNDNECWLWKASLDGNGRGQFWFNSKVMRASRVAYILANGNIPENMEICHTCDNSLCCNPKHLVLMNHYENMKDMIDKGRDKKAHGETHSKVKGTGRSWELINNIRKDFKENGLTRQQLLEKYKLPKSTIYYILKNRNWYDENYVP